MQNGKFSAGTLFFVSTLKNVDFLKCKMHQSLISLPPQWQSSPHGGTHEAAIAIKTLLTVTLVQYNYHTCSVILNNAPHIAF